MTSIAVQPASAIGMSSAGRGPVFPAPSSRTTAWPLPDVATNRSALPSRATDAVLTAMSNLRSNVRAGPARRARRPPVQTDWSGACRKRVDRPGQAGFRLLGDGADARGIDDSHGGERIHRLDDDLRPLLAEDDIAGQERADGRIGLERPTGERRVARTEDEVRCPIHAELRLQGGLHIDLGEDAEALGPELCLHGRAHAGDRPRQPGPA